jgi:hypothetical protein
MLAIAAWLAIAALPTGAVAQTGMPNPKEMSGVPLPMPDAPAGSVSVRVIRGSFDNVVVGVPVAFVVEGEPRTVVTDAEGRAEVSGLKPGTAVRASVVVDGERLETQPMSIGTSGLRVLLVATDPAAAAAAAAAAVPGTVVLGPESRVIAEMQDDRLNIFYMIEVVNAAATPVDIDGPLTFDLPRSARGTTMLEGSSPQAVANGPHVTVTGPFAPGKTRVEIAFELPYSGGTARIDQVWPAALQQVNLLVMQVGGLTVTSPQLSQTRDIVDQGQPLIVGMGPAIAAGQALVLEIGGLPHHAVWPRNTALALATAIMAVGIWAAAFPGTRPDRRQRRG